MPITVHWLFFTANTNNTGWMRGSSGSFLLSPWLYVNSFLILQPHPTQSGRARSPSGAFAASFLPAQGNRMWQDEQRQIYCRLHLIFPSQEEIFHLEPGKVESGKGKCSYDPKLNSVSALISEYHLAVFFSSSFLKCLQGSTSKRPLMPLNHVDLSSFPASLPWRPLLLNWCALVERRPRRKCLSLCVKDGRASLSVPYILSFPFPTTKPSCLV